MGMHKLFNDDYSGRVDTPTMAEKAELAQYTSMNRWFAEQIWGAGNLRPVTKSEASCT
jgi:hypothetical protein